MDTNYIAHYGFVLVGLLPPLLLAAAGIVLALRFRSLSAYLAAIGFITSLAGSWGGVFVGLAVQDQLTSTGDTGGNYQQWLSLAYYAALLGPCLASLGLLLFAFKRNARAGESSVT